MALGQNDNRKKIYLSIGNGKVVKGSGAAKEEYSYIDGTIEAIYTKRSSFRDEEVERWFIDIRDGNDLYSLCLPYASGVFKSIILALVSDEALTSSTPVRIEPYEGKNGYTKVVVYSDGVKLDWITKQLPPQQTIKVGGKQVRDDSEQMKLICHFVDVLRQRIEK